MPSRSLAVAVLRHPGLWVEALRASAAAAPRDWWRRPPFLPLPDPDLLRWRVETAYGRPGPVAPQDLVAYLRWRKRQRATRRPGRGGGRWRRRSARS